MRDLTTRFRALAIALVTCAGHAAAQADTSFTYQGALKDNGSPANGSYNIDVGLWDALSGGTQIGSTVMFNGLAVAEGLFTVELDFGANAFDNAARWLEIAVNGVTLVPRQPITRSPYSIQTRGIFVDEDNNVGIGTATPQRNLDIEASEAVLRLTTTDDSPTTTSRLQLKSVNASGTATPLGAIEFLSEDDTKFASIQGARRGTDATISFIVGPASSFPQLRISGSGDVLFGQHGLKPALAYGKVTGGGFVVSGSSNVLSVERASTGLYRINVEGGVLDTDVVQVTLETIGFVTAKGVNGQALVRTYGRGSGNPPTDRAFSFVVYRP